MTPRSESDLPFERLRQGIEALVVVPCPTSAADPKTHRLQHLPNAIRYVPPSRMNFYIRLDGTFADCLTRLPAKARHEMVRKRRNFARMAGEDSPGIRVYRRPEDVEEFQRIAHTISAKTYQYRQLKLGLPDDEQFRSELKAHAAADRLRGYILFQKDRAVAFGFCVVKGDILYYNKTGYDPDMSQCSPGIVLLYGLLELAFAERRFTILNLGIGEAQWKRTYATDSMKLTEAYYFRPTLRNGLFAAGHALTTELSDFGGRLLSALHLKERYKTLCHKVWSQRVSTPSPEGEGFSSNA
jgi:CelD/BcsL family acetyltransferase involved in cellulose biosynthesis